MTVSGTTSFTISRDDIIGAALRKLERFGSGDPIPAQDITDCAFALNLMVKALAKKGILIWCVSDISVTMVGGVSAYPIGLTAGYLNSVSTITNAGSGGTPGTYALTLTGGGGTGAAGTYTIGANGKLSSIAITAGGNSYTSAPAYSFPLGGIAGAAASGSIVGLTTHRPLRITNAILRDASGNDTPLNIVSRSDYNAQGNKTTPGVPNQLMLDPQISSVTVTVLNVPTDGTETLILTQQRQAMDFNLSTDNPDFPQEFYEALVYGLADRIALDYHVKASIRQEIAIRAATSLEECVSFEQENTSVFFSPSQQAR